MYGEAAPCCVGPPSLFAKEPSGLDQLPTGTDFVRIKRQGDADRQKADRLYSGYSTSPVAGAEP